MQLRCPVGDASALHASKAHAGAPFRIALQLHLLEMVLQGKLLQRPKQSPRQAFRSALPVACSELPRPSWERSARLVLAPACEAMMLAAVDRRRSGQSDRLLLTCLGGGTFGNNEAAIDDAIDDATMRAWRIVEVDGLEYRWVRNCERRGAALMPALRVLLWGAFGPYE